MAFLKFIDKKGADSFISGIVQFGTAKEYLYIEKKKMCWKNDEMEGKYYTTKYQTPQGKGLILRLMLINRKGILPYVISFK